MAPDRDGPAIVVGVVAAVFVLAAAWRAARWLHPLLSAAALLLVVVLVPGPGRADAAVLALPVVAIAVAVLAEQVGERVAGRWRDARRAALPLALFVTAVTLPALISAVLRAPAPAGSPLVRWVSDETAPSTVLRADALDRAELAAAGIAPERLRDLDGDADPGDPGELTVLARRPSGGLPSVVRCVGAAVATVARGTGAAAGAICSVDPGAVAVVEGERDARHRVGAELAGNRSLTLAPAAAELLRGGEVDSRALIVLTVLAASRCLTIADFPAVDLDAAGVPRRKVLVTTVDGLPAAGPPQPLLRSWLDAQQPPLAPAVVRVDGDALVIGYPSPPVGGLLPG